MKDREVFYGQITALVNSDYASENFFKGLKYKDNFLKQYNLFLYLDKKLKKKKLNILSSFDFKSKNKNINTFKYMILTCNDNEKLIKEIEKIKDNEDFFIEKVSKKKNNIIIIFK